MPSPPPDPSARAPLSAVVISCNRAWAIETCLAALAFADEVILVDKASTDGTAERGALHADRVIGVPWSPTVEETRAFAVARCTHEWVLLLDDDECLDPEAVLFIAAELAAPRADVYLLPRREYIIGCHDERCYYWPEWHPRLFRRDAVAFTGTVHGGTTLLSERVHRIPPETQACIHHLSHRSVGQWIEKTNRYTSRPDRVRASFVGTDLAAFAHAAIARWCAASRPAAPDDGPSAVAVLRATYDIIDRLKTWEEERGLDGAAAFREVCATLQTAYVGRLAHLQRPHHAPGVAAAAAAPAALPTGPAPGEMAGDTAGGVAGDIPGDVARGVPRDMAKGVARTAPEEAAREATRVTALRSMLGALREDAAELQARLAAEQRRGEADRRDAAAEQDRLIAARDQAEAAHHQAIAARDQADAALCALRGRADAQEAALRGLQASTFWRATGPLRRFAARHEVLARRVRNSARLARRALARGAGTPENRRV
ncbi:MAG: glycosyltransferase [Acetobacteraceae bacterium]